MHLSFCAVVNRYCAVTSQQRQSQSLLDHQSNVPNGQRRRDVAVPEEKMYAVASHIQRSKGQIPLVVYHLFTGSNSRNEQEVTKLLRDTKHLQNLATSHLMISDNRARSCTARISLSLSLSRRSFALAGCCRHR